MLLKKNRANKKDLEEVFKKGLFLRSGGFTFTYIKKLDTKDIKISFVVPKNICKSAVKRNSFRRKGYRILRKKILIK